jgi:RNA polymerase sigma factor (sigma-70 family)
MSASVTTWIGKLKDGQPQAAQQLWHRYYARLVALARQKLIGLPKRASDEEDVVLSAFHSFCKAVDAGRFPMLESRDDLWQILVMHTARKAVDRRRYEARQKRHGQAAGQGVLEEIVGEEPDPEFAASVAEELASLLAVLDEDLLRSIANKKLAGYTNREIAEELGWSHRTVERKLAVIRAMWSEQLDLDATGGGMGGNSTG